jgi:hypothetical protein
MISPKNRNRALTTAVASLIILVISLLLASVVTYFATNVVSTRAQEESVHLTKQHLWYNSESNSGVATYSSVASLMVINTGGRVVVIDKIAVRGQESPWNTNNKFVVYTITSKSVASDLPFIPNLSATQENKMSIDGDNYVFAVAQDDIALPAGDVLIAYVVNPDSITINDVGLTVGIALDTAQAVYYAEANVQSG